MSDKPKLEGEASEQPVLRRSSRSTRGSVKPVVDLTKDDVVDGSEKEEEVEVYEEVKQKKSTRRGSTKPASLKKTPVKRSTNKKPIIKQESHDKITKSSEEKEEGKAQPDQEETRHQSVGKVKNETTPEHDNSGTVDDDNVDDELFYDLNEKEMKEINNAFDMNRMNDDELLNADGLRTAMRLLGFEPRGDEIKKLVKKFAAKKSGKVTRDGFHRIMAFKYSTTPTMRNDRSNDEISRVFNLLDLDKTGMITLENLRSISKELNEELTDEDLQEMIQEADMDGDFKINKDEFHNIMKKTSLY